MPNNLHLLSILLIEEASVLANVSCFLWTCCSGTGRKGWKISHLDMRRCSAISDLSLENILYEFVAFDYVFHFKLITNLPTYYSRLFSKLKESTTEMELLTRKESWACCKGYAQVLFEAWIFPSSCRFDWDIPKRDWTSTVNTLE